MYTYIIAVVFRTFFQTEVKNSSKLPHLIWPCARVFCIHVFVLPSYRCKVCIFVYHGVFHRFYSVCLVFVSALRVSKLFERTVGSILSTGKPDDVSKDTPFSSMPTFAGVPRRPFLWPNSKVSTSPFATYWTSQFFPLRVSSSRTVSRR